MRYLGILQTDKSIKLCKTSLYLSSDNVVSFPFMEPKTIIILTHPVPNFGRLRVALHEPPRHLPVPEEDRLVQQTVALNVGG